MKIKTLHLQNFRGFEDLTIKFPKDNVAVFIGENGAGKSAILDAIGVLFSQIIAKSIRQAFASTKKPDIVLGYEDYTLCACGVSNKQSWVTSGVDTMKQEVNSNLV